MAEAESDEAARLSQNKASEVVKIPTIRVLYSGKEAVRLSRDKSSEMVKSPNSTVFFPSNVGVFRQIRSKTFGMLKFLSNTRFPLRKGPEPSDLFTKFLAETWDEDLKSSYFVEKSLAEMVDEDPIRLRNQSCEIRRETVKTLEGVQRLVYSSLARLPTFSIGLSSTRKEEPSPASLRKSSVDPKDQSPLRYFQMPELGARVFVGNVDGFDTVTCRLLDKRHHASQSDLDSEFAAVRSVYKGDCHGELGGWMRAKFKEFRRSEDYFDLILSGTELFRTHNVSPIMVGNLGGKSSEVSGSSSAHEDCGGDETRIRQSSEVVEQPEYHLPGVCSYCPGYWFTCNERMFYRLPRGSYLRKPEFVKLDDLNYLKPNRLEKHILQLTKFDDFIILGDKLFFNDFFSLGEVIDIVRQNASKTPDVIATQIVKGAMEEWPSTLWPITFIVILLDHKEIMGKEKENMTPKDTAKLLGALGPKAISQSIVLRDDKEIAESKEEEIVTLKEEEKVFSSKMEDKKGIMTEEDHKVKILGEPLPNVPQVLTASLEENELQMKSTPINSKLASVEVQDNSEASSSTILIEGDDCQNKDFMVSCHITKWIIYGDLQEITLLCFFNVEENKHEFYFEDHESMATIIGLGLPHSKVVLEYGSPYVTVVEIPKEDWDVVRAHLYTIPLSIPKGNVLKQEIFPDILHCIANVINTEIIVSKANGGGVGGNNGKDKSKGNDDSNDKGKGKAHDHCDHGNTSHPNGGSNGAPNDNDNKEKKEKDGNDDKKDNQNDDGRKTFNDGKEVQATVYVHLWPGGVLEEKGKKKKLQEVNMEEGEEKIKEVHEGVVKKKMKHLPTLWQVLKRPENGNIVGNQQKSTTTSGIENDDDESLRNQLKEQIHAEMVFTFRIKDEVGGQLKTIQAIINPITFQFPSKNKKNYLQRRRFGWFHEKLKVAFGVVDPKVAYLDAKSCKVLDSLEVEELSSKGTSKGDSKTSTNVYKGKMGVKYGIIAQGEYNRTNGSEDKTTDEVQNSYKINKKVTKRDFFISDRINLNFGHLKYSFRPRLPFKEKEFEEKGEDDRLNMYYQDPICQPHQVSCEGTWLPYDSRNLEAYKLEASRELRMTRIYNPKPKIVEEKKQKGARKIEGNLPLRFIQKLEKVVYLNHSMSHLTSSTTGVYRLREIDVPSNSSTFLTQGQYNEKPKWPQNNALINVKQ